MHFSDLWSCLHGFQENLVTERQLEIRWEEPLKAKRRGATPEEVYIFGSAFGELQLALLVPPHHHHH